MKTYLLIVCITLFAVQSPAQNNCVGSMAMTASPVQPVGGYAPGTTVDICITLTNYSQLSAVWLHGVGVNFGPGWDIATITSTPFPGCDGQGNWAWYNSCLSSASGLAFGPGFYYDSPAGSTSGTIDGIPGNNYGDNCQNNTWNFCFSIQTIQNTTSTIPLTGHVIVTGDGTSGTWANPGCDTEYLSFNSLLSGTSCAASFSYSIIPVAGVPLELMNTSTGIFPTYSWTLGDGNTSVAENPIHTYVTAGTYNLCLVINDSTGCSDSLCANVNVVTNYWNGTYPYFISGTIFYDVDSNGVKDAYETGLDNQFLSIQPMNATAISQASGNYGFPVNAGNYIVSIVPPAGWTMTTDSSLYQIHIDSFTGSLGGFDFGFIPDQLSADVSLNFHPGNSSCINTTQQYLDVENTGTTFSSGVISYLKHDSVNVIGTSPAPDSLNQSVYYWHYTHIAPFQNEQIFIEVDKPNTIGFSFYSVSYADVRDTSNNILISEIDTTNETVTCSFDPNAKYVSPVSEIMGQNYTLIGEQLTYTITFQNTGNAPAVNVVVVDTLPATLDFTSFHLVASSHDVAVVTSLNGIITFVFNGIYLPDSASNESGSHGFVVFNIEALSSISNNTLVQNTASIFFDQNAPVQTSTASTTFVLNLPTGISESTINDNEIFVYPNPTSGILTVNTSTSTSSDDLEIFDFTGKLISRQPLKTNNSIDFTHFTKGVYTVKILQNENVRVFKIVYQ